MFTFTNAVAEEKMNDIQVRGRSTLTELWQRYQLSNVTFESFVQFRFYSTLQRERKFHCVRATDMQCCEENCVQESVIHIKRTKR
jgi:hypothetical protein